jgi:hypothetical protein
MRSDCGRYTIVKYGIADDEYRYELWDRKNLVAGKLLSASEAIRAHTLHLATQVSSTPATLTTSAQSPDGDRSDGSTRNCATG